MISVLRRFRLHISDDERRQQLVNHYLYTAMYTSTVKQYCQHHVLGLQKQACTSAIEHKTQIYIQEYRKIITSRNTRFM